MFGYQAQMLNRLYVEKDHTALFWKIIFSDTGKYECD